MAAAWYFVLRVHALSLGCLVLGAASCAARGVFRALRVRARVRKPFDAGSGSLGSGSLRARSGFLLGVLPSPVSLHLCSHHTCVLTSYPRRHHTSSPSPCLPYYIRSYPIISYGIVSYNFITATAIINGHHHIIIVLIAVALAAALVHYH